MTAGADGLHALPQGDRRLLGHPVAERLLGSRELARVAYVADDGAPRVLPMLFHWADDELVLATFGGGKIGAIRSRPDIAVTIDAASTPPEVLLLRGRATVEAVPGIVPEYLLAHARYGGEERAEEVRAEIDRPGLTMHRIRLRPAWVGVLDFTTRFPGGITSSAEFSERLG